MEHKVFALAMKTTLCQLNFIVVLNGPTNLAIPTKIVRFAVA